MAGVRSEEIDSLDPDAPPRAVSAPGNSFRLSGEPPVRDNRKRVHAERAAVLATSRSRFYAGMPALTMNTYGLGRVYSLPTRPAANGFLDGLVRGLASQASLARCLEVDVPEGVTVQKRGGGGRAFYFLHKFRRTGQGVDLGGLSLKSIGDGRVLTGRAAPAPSASLVLERA
jgi:beta-galactosidase